MKKQYYTLQLTNLEKKEVRKFEYTSFHQARQGLIELCEAYNLPFDWNQICDGFETGGIDYKYHLKLEYSDSASSEFFNPQ
jgi:hypothetical protein